MLSMNHGLTRRFLLPLTSVCALSVGLADPAFGQQGGQQDPAKQDVNVTDFDTVDLSVQDADLAQVLQMLSIQSRKNIISSKNVSATVTANLYDVTFHEALDAILKVNGFTWEEKGNFIYVYTQDEYNRIQEANRKTTSRTFELNYLSARDGIEFITPLLSDKGKASARGDVKAGFKPTSDDGGGDSYAYNVKIVVNDYPENLDAIAALLGELDTAPDQVMVEATILQAAVDEANAFGIDFNIIGNMDFTNISAPLRAVDNLFNGRNPVSGFQPADNKAHAVGTSVGNTGGPGGLKVDIISNDISVFLRVLDEVTDSTILARPKIMALNRQRAEVLVGARIGYLSTTATETTTTQSVEFLDTGIQLVFRPFISKDGMIRLELKPSVSEASLRTVTQANSTQVTIPDELTNELTTNVRVRDGQTVVLGGLFKESTTITRRQVPLLGDIPILGAAFRGQDDNVERDEIIFLITPSIARDEVLWENGHQMLAMTELVRIGARNGLLPFSREKMTTSYNQSAMDAAAAGDTELALYHIRNSLRLNANQPEMIALRQRLSGDVEKGYERSLLERVLKRNTERQSDARSNSTPTFDRDPLLALNRVTISVKGQQNQNDSSAAPPSTNAASSTPAQFALQPVSDPAAGQPSDATTAPAENSSDFHPQDVAFDFDAALQGAGTSDAAANSANSRNTTSHHAAPTPGFEGLDETSTGFTFAPVTRWYLPQFFRFDPHGRFQTTVTEDASFFDRWKNVGEE